MSGDSNNQPPPRAFIEEIAPTLPADANHRTLDEIKTILETHCQPCELFTGHGCRDFELQGSACSQRKRFIRRLTLRMFGCERWVQSKNNSSIGSNTALTQP